MHDAPPSWRWAQGSCALALWWATACSAPVSVDDADAEMPEAAPDEPPGWRAEPGVDELDVMKSDGKTLFVVRSNRLRVFAASTLTPMADLPLGISQAVLLSVGSRLVVVGRRCDQTALRTGTLSGDPCHPTRTGVSVIDVSSRAHPVLLAEWTFDGAWRGARQVGGVLWLAVQAPARGSAGPGEAALVAVDVASEPPLSRIHRVSGPPDAIVFGSSVAYVAVRAQQGPRALEVTRISGFHLTASAERPAERGAIALAGHLAGRGAMQLYRGGLAVVTRGGGPADAACAVVTVFDERLAFIGLALLTPMPSASLETRLVGDALFVGPRDGDLAIVSLSAQGPPVPAGRLPHEGDWLSIRGVTPAALLTAHLLAAEDGEKPGIALKALDLSDLGRPRPLGTTAIGLGTSTRVPETEDIFFWRPEGLVGVPVAARRDGRVIAGLALSRLSLAQGFMSLERLDHEPTAHVSDARVLHARVFGESLYVLSTAGVSLHALNDLRRDAYADAP